MTTTKAHEPIHPGEILREEFLTPMGISAYALAKAIGVPQTRIGAILHGQRAITADTALRLSRYFGLSDRYWIQMQEDYELEVARDALGDQLEKITPLTAA